MDLEESAKQWVLANLPYDKTDVELDARLNSLDARDILIVFHNWMSRQIMPAPRKVHKSQAYLANPIVTERAAELTQLEEEIASGALLKPRLSKASDAVLSPEGTKLHRRRELDLMLNDWGIHHLHISSEMEGDYVKRDGPVLFAVFHPQDAYLIDVMTHKDWARDHVVKVLYDEWPDKGMLRPLNGVIGLARNYSEDERLQLRKAGINVMLEVGGRVFMPAGGMTTAGTSVAASRQTDALVLDLKAFEKSWEQNPQLIRMVFERSGVTLPEEPDFQFHILPEGGYGVLEGNTRAFLPL